MANYYDPYGSPYLQHPQAPPSNAHPYGYGHGFTTGPQHGTGLHSSPAERPAPTRGATQQYMPQAYGSGAYYPPPLVGVPPQQQQSAYAAPYAPLVREPPTVNSSMNLYEMKLAIAAKKAKNAELERQLYEEDALRRAGLPVPPLDQRSSSATSGPTGPTYGIFVAKYGQGEAWEESGQGEAWEESGQAEAWEDLDSRNDPADDDYDRQSSYNEREFRRGRTRPLQDSSRIGRNRPWERQENRLDRRPTRSDEYAQSTLIDCYPHHPTREEYGLDEFLADRKKEENFGEARFWVEMTKYNKLSGTECCWQSPPRRTQSTFRRSREPFGSITDAYSVERSKLDGMAVAAPPWRSARVEAARREAHPSARNAASVELAAGRSRKSAKTRAAQRQSMQVADFCDSADSHQSLVRQLDEVLDMTFPTAYHRVAPRSWSVQWHRNAVDFKELGFFSGPHPRCCETIFTRQWGHLPGEHCFLRHEWFTKNELVYMVSNPNKTKAEMTKKWLKDALETWVANSEAGHI